MNFTYPRTQWKSNYKRKKALENAKLKAEKEQQGDFNEQEAEAEAEGDGKATNDT